MNEQDFFTPVTEPSGFLPADLAELAAGRDIYIWGAGFGGENLSHFLEKHGVTIKGFCDKKFEEISKSETLDKPVLNPEEVIKLCKNGKAYIVISVFTAAKSLKALCEAEGLLPERDFITFIRLKRLETEIRIGDRPFMSFENFKKAYDKLEKECPYLFLVDLAGENPRDNPDFSKITKLLSERNQRYYVLSPAGSDPDYLYPYEKYIELAEKMEKGDSEMDSPEYINNYDNKEVITALAGVRDRPCIVSRMYPVINSDLSAGLCHLFKYPVAAPDYLDTDLSELFNIRENHPHCVLCQKYGIQRLDFYVPPLSSIRKRNV